MEELYCGVDLGTTNLKVLLCDGHGRVAAVRSCPTPRMVLDGATVTDPAALLSAVETLLTGAWDAIGRRGRIAAIASAGVGEDGFLIGGDGAPSSLSIPWFDRRAEAEAEELAETCRVSQWTGIAFDATRTAAKWLWMNRREPAWDSGGTWVALTDWPLVAWTGRPVMTEALAARTACWDITRHSWLVEALDAAGAPALPPVVAGGSVIGPLARDSFPVRLGAADARTLVVAGGHDHPVAAAPIMMGFPGAIVDSLGTAELVHAETPVRLRAAEGLVRTIPAVPGMIDACLHVFEIDRFLSTLPSRRLRDELASEGGYDGLSADVRHALEDASMVTAEVLERMRKAGVPDGDLFATGGRARSDRFMQLRADVLDRPILRVEEGELCALGAAIVAAAGAGVTIVPGLDVTRFAPDPKQASVYRGKRILRAGEIRSLLGNEPR